MCRCVALWTICHHCQRAKFMQAHFLSKFHCLLLVSSSPCIKTTLQVYTTLFNKTTLQAKARSKTFCLIREIFSNDSFIATLWSFAVGSYHPFTVLYIMIYNPCYNSLIYSSFIFHLSRYYFYI